MTINKHELLGVPRYANQHRLSRLTMEVHTDELRIMASAVESYTDQLIAALESSEKRNAELESSHNKLHGGMAAIYNAICADGARTSLSAILTFVKRAFEESKGAAAGIKGE